MFALIKTIFVLKDISLLAKGHTESPPILISIKAIVGAVSLSATSRTPSFIEKWRAGDVISEIGCMSLDFESNEKYYCL